MRLTLLLLLLAALLLWWHTAPQQHRAPRVPTCQLPLTYRLASVDSAFRLSQSELQQQIDHAAAQWNQAAGFAVLLHDATDGFPIHFVFDQRQQQLLEQVLLQRNLQRYDQRITEQQQDFTAKLADFTQRQQAFASQDQLLAAAIGQFNQKARQADPAMAATLGRQQAELLSRQKEHALEAAQLEAEQEKLQSQQQLLNDLINKRNHLIPTDHTNSSLAEVGLLEQQGQQRKMTIFAYKDQHALQLTLLHEFGHALGIGHLSEPNAVMHAILNGQQQQLTAADVAALKQQCRQ